MSEIEICEHEGKTIGFSSAIGSVYRHRLGSWQNRFHYPEALDQERAGVAEPSEMGPSAIVALVVIGFGLRLFRPVDIQNIPRVVAVHLGQCHLLPRGSGACRC